MDCHATATHHFCPKCGQKTRSPRGHFRVLIADFLQSWIGADAKLWPTVWRLLRHPGALTLDYREGRRTRYLSPLRIYFFFTILFFLTFSFSPNRGAIFSTSDSSADATVENTAFQDAVRETVPLQSTWLGGLVHDRMMESAKHLDAMPVEQANKVVADHIYANLPIALFLCLPIIALALRVVFWKSQQIFFDHFMFTLHIVAFFFAGLLVVRIVSHLPGISVVAPGVVIAFVLWQPIYFVRALHVSTGRAYLAGFFTGAWLTLVLLPTILAVLVGLVFFGILQA